MNLEVSGLNPVLMLNIPLHNNVQDNIIQLFKFNTHPETPEKPVIGEFEQGYLNDCWLCSIVKSLSGTLDGKKQLREMITENNDGSYTVNFPNNVNFTITDEELKDDRVKLANGEYARRKESMFYFSTSSPFIKYVHNPAVTYSKGDKNLKLIEIAANKYVHKLVADYVKKGIIPKENVNSFCWIIIR